jgi:hypothetical protein
LLIGLRGMHDAQGRLFPLLHRSPMRGEAVRTKYYPSDLARSGVMALAAVSPEENGADECGRGWSGLYKDE